MIYWAWVRTVAGPYLHWQNHPAAPLSLEKLSVTGETCEVIDGISSGQAPAGDGELTRSGRGKVAGVNLILLFPDPVRHVRSGHRLLKGFRVSANVR